MSEVCTIANFFSEKIRWVAFSTDMGDCDTSILYPFASGVFAMFNMVVAFSCQIMAPFHASIVVVVDGCSRGGISDGIAK
jgi:hypothetical protein